MKKPDKLKTWWDDFDDPWLGLTFWVLATVTCSLVGGAIWIDDGVLSDKLANTAFLIGCISVPFGFAWLVRNT